MSFQNKILAAVFGSGVLDTVAAIVVARWETDGPGNGTAVPKGGSLRSRIVEDRLPAGPAKPKAGEFRYL